MTSAIEVFVAFVGHLIQCYRREWHEFRTLKLFVQPIINCRVLGVIHNRAVSQCTRAEFHPSLKTCNDVPLLKQFCKPLLERPTSTGDLLVFKTGRLKLAPNLFS